MADPFVEPLPTIGDKPWNLNNVILEIRNRASTIQDDLTALKQSYALITSPEKYGAAGNNTGDDSTAVEQALAERSAFGKVNVVLLGQYRITRELRWDVSKTMITGQGGVLMDAINNSTKWLLTAYSTDPGDIGSPIRQAALGMKNVILWGAGKTNGLNISGASFGDKPAHVGFSNVVITGFGTAIRFGRNAYMIRFSQSNITLSRTGLLYDGAENAGERLSFVDCDITGHGTAIVSSGQAMNFIDCSFSYNRGRIAKLTGGAQVYITSGSHIEMDAPFKPWFSLSGGGTMVNVTDTRWLMRDRSMVTLASTFTSGNPTVAWADNPSDRFEVGDPFRFGGPFGPTNIDSTTTYYFTQVSGTGYQFSATLGGTPITPDASGTAAGILPVQGAVMAEILDPTSMFVIRGGHISGSSSTVRTQTLSSGVGGFRITETTGYDQQTLRFRNRAAGDLFDGQFTQTSILDDFEVDGVGTLAISGGQLVFTKTTTGSGDIRLWIPVEEAARFFLEYGYQTSSAVAVSHSAFWRPRKVNTSRTALYTSTLNAGAGVMGNYVQAGFIARHAPAGTRYLLLTWTISNLAIGDTFRLMNVYPSIS